METILNYINGEMVEPVGGAYLDNINPSTGLVYAKTPDSDARDIENAVAAATQAFPAWSNMPTNLRSAAMMKLADLIEANLDELAMTECVDNGKPLSLARSLDIPRAVENFRFFATAIIHFHSESHLMDSVALNYTLRKPRGVAGIISPWNLPLYLLSWKIAPALATGNTVVAKPSEVTPMTAYKLSLLCQQAGLPAGVLNIVHGTGARSGAALVAHKSVPTISFTGGTATGAEIARSAGPMFKKVALEMGGKNPNIIFADAEIDAAVRGSLKSSFANQGQVCLCGSRIYVESSIYEKFVEQFVEAAKKLKVGDPLEKDSDQGAIVSKVQFEKVLSYLQLARDEGGKIRCGGGAAIVAGERCKNGYFIAPTVITDLPIHCRVNKEEIFGPVCTITPFENEDEVVAFANDTDYGLSASVWTKDVGRAHRVADRINAGTVWINCWLVRDLRVPFGGMKQSGMGREGGLEALRFYTEPKNVCVRVPSRP